VEGGDDVRGCYDPILVPHFFVGLNVQNEIRPYNPLKTVWAFEFSTLISIPKNFWPRKSR